MSSSARSRSVKQMLWSTSILGVVDNVLRSLSVFIVSPMLVGGLGQDQYGLWVLLLAWVGWLETLDLGMANTAARYFAASVSRHDAAETSSLFFFFRRHYRRVGGAVFLLSFLGAGVLYLVWPAARASQVPQMFMVLGMAQGSVMLFRVYPALLKGHLEYRTTILAGLGRVLLFAGGLASLYFSTISLHRVVALHVSLLLLEQLFLYLKARRLAPAEAVPFEDRAKEKEIVGFAGKNIVWMASLLLRDKIDTQILAFYLSLTSVTQYAVGVRLPTMAMDLSNAVFGGHLVAGFTAAGARKSPEEMLEDLFRVLRFSAWLGLTGCVLLFVLGPPFILRWLGPEFGPAGQVLCVLVPGIALTVMQYPSLSVLVALNKHGRLGLLYLASSVLNLLLSVVAVPWLGLTGVSWGTTVELAIQGMVGMPWLIKNALPVSGRAYFARALLKPLLIYACGVLPAVLLAMGNWRPGTYPELAGAMAAIGFVAGLTGFVFVLKSTDRAFVFQRVRSLLRMG